MAEKFNQTFDARHCAASQKVECVHEAKQYEKVAGSGRQAGQSDQLPVQGAAGLGMRRPGSSSLGGASLDKKRKNWLLTVNQVFETFEPKAKGMLESLCRTGSRFFLD